MVGLDVTSQAVLTNHEVTAIRALGRVGEMFYGLFRHYRGGSLTTGLKMHDVCAIAYLLHQNYLRQLKRSLKLLWKVQLRELLLRI